MTNGADFGTTLACHRAGKADVVSDGMSIRAHVEPNNCRCWLLTPWCSGLGVWECSVTPCSRASRSKAFAPNLCDVAGW